VLPVLPAMERPIHCVLPAEILRKILHYRLFGYGTQAWPALERSWHHTPTSKYHFLSVASEIVADVFPLFGVHCCTVSIAHRPGDYSPSGTLRSVGYQFAALRLMVLKYQFTPFLLDCVTVDLRGLCDTATLQSLTQMFDAFAMLKKAICNTPLPTLNLSITWMAPEFCAPISNIVALGITSICINVASLVLDMHHPDITDPDDPMLWTASMDFSPTHFKALTYLCLEGSLLLDQRGFLSCVLKQESVTTLTLHGTCIHPADWGFILHAIVMPKLHIFTVQGRLRCTHFGEFIRHHSHIHHLRFGPGSRWLDDHFALLRIPLLLYTIDGPHDMIAPFFHVYKTLGAVRHLRLHPSMHHSVFDWDFDMLDRLLDMISRTPDVISLALDITPATLARFIGYLYERPTLRICTQRLIIAQESTLNMDNVCMVRPPLL
jgi:hypothetical protein